LNKAVEKEASSRELALAQGRKKSCGRSSAIMSGPTTLSRNVPTMDTFRCRAMTRLSTKHVGPCPARKNSRDIPNPARQISVIRGRTLKRLQVNEPGSRLTSPMRGGSDVEGQEICTGSLW